jgi:SAM-dependent methyltransferase
MRHLFTRARRLVAGRRGGDPDAELRWWLEVWNPIIEAGGFFPGDVASFLDEGEEAAPTYEGRRWQIARAEVLRMLDDAAIEDPDFFRGKTVVDIGPGPMGFPDACPAGVRIGIEPLAQRFDDLGLLLASDAIYLPVMAENMPLLASSVDVVLSRNSLDHVTDPRAVVEETMRVLRPGGTFILNVDVEHRATATEPHAFTVDHIRALLARMEISFETVIDHSHGGEGRMLVAVARMP